MPLKIISPFTHGLFIERLNLHVKLSHQNTSSELSSTENKFNRPKNNSLEFLCIAEEKKFNYFFMKKIKTYEKYLLTANLVRFC